MNSSIEPWKLTAYLLGELEADEAQRLRQIIEADPAIQQEMHGLQQVISRTRQAFESGHVAPLLDDAQQSAIAEQIRHASVASAPQNPACQAMAVDVRPSTDQRQPLRMRSRFMALAALAASLLLAVFVSPYFLGFPQLGLRSPDEEIDKERLQPDDARRMVAGQVDSPLNTRPGPDAQATEPKDDWVADSAGLAMDEAVKNPYGNSPSIAYGDTSGGGKDWASAVADPSSQFGQFGAPLSAGDKSLRETTSELAPAPSESVKLEAVESIVEKKLWETTYLDPSNEAGLATQSGPFGGGASPSRPPITGRPIKPLDDQSLLANGPSPELPATIAANSRADGFDVELQVNAAPSAPDDPRRLTRYDRQPVLRGASPVPKYTAPSQDGDRYEPIVETPFAATEQSPLSTFSIDVDTASYSKIRQYLMQANQLPQPNAVRIEEMINYFDYDYAGPTDEHPFASNMAVSTCPWNEDHKLVRIGLQAKKMDVKERVKANLVFLLDVSGSMDEPNKLPLVKQAMSMLIRQLGENDRIAMVVYAGAAGCVLPSITGDKQAQILTALNDLNAGGSTNGGQGIELAYSIAREHFIPGGINRVILCTDGDFNVGTTSNEALVKLVQEQAKSKVFLTCLGFGIGNYNDSMMEQISNQGNGVYGMVDNAIEARRMMIEQLAGTLVTVAKDVKIQVEFNPAKIAGYRLIGYENRRLANEDFNNDQKDAGEIGAGHCVTALYEVVPVGVAAREKPLDDLRYGRKSRELSHPSPDLPSAGPSSQATTADVPTASETAFAEEWLTLKLRYKQPEGDVSSKLEFFLTDAAVMKSEVDVDLKWSSAVAEFGLLLRRSQLAPQANWNRMLQRARAATGDNLYRLECLEMMSKAKALAGE